MRTTTSFAVCLVLFASACGSSSPSKGAGGTAAGGATSGGSSGSNGGGAGGTAGNGGTSPAGSQLKLSLDPTIDGEDGVSKATSITSADLLDKTGTKVASGTIAGGTASVDLTGIAAGDFFIEVNGDADDLVPTRIDDPLKTVEQRVGEKLRSSYIGPVAAPVYRINTYSAGQSFGPVVQYSDGAAISGEQPYVIMTLAVSAPKIEFGVLGSAHALSSLTPNATHMSGSQPFDSWVLNTTGQQHHGDMAMGAGGGGGAGGMSGGMSGLPMCASCHTNLDTKPTAHSAITAKNGWCFQCHNGPTGPDTGFVDPAR